jgi:pimeloyl-ACP methyl ester carboxylesterase
MKPLEPFVREAGSGPLAKTRMSARGVMRALLPVLPHARVQEFDAVGHMGPITHPEPINAAIERFLDDVHR